MKAIFKLIIKLFVIITCISSLALFSLMEVITLLRLLFGRFSIDDEMTTLTIAALPMVIYCWTMWLSKESIDKINSITK